MIKLNPGDEVLADIGTNSNNRMSRVYAALPTLSAIAIVMGILVGIRMGGLVVLRWLSSVESEVVAAIIAGAATSIVGFGAVIISQQRSKTREISESHRPQKIQLYVRFIKKVMDVMIKYKNDNSGNAIAENTELVSFYQEFVTDLVIWGSRDVIQAYGKFRVASENSDLNILVAMDDLLRAMRKDLGHSDWLLKRGELIKTFLKNPDELDKFI